MAIFDEAAQAVAAEHGDEMPKGERPPLIERVELIESRLSSLVEHVGLLTDGHGKYGDVIAKLLREVGR